MSDEASPKFFSKKTLRDPAALVLALLAIEIAVAFDWGLPCPDSWCADSVSPRTCGLGAIVETYWPGHFHNYPPLHTAILTVFSLPWMALAASRAGTDMDALGLELVKPLYMTAIEASARLVAAAMTLSIAWNTMRLWGRIAGRRAGVAAGAIVATNATLVFYAHTGNLDVPYLFWLAWALVEIDRVASGERRELHVMLLAGAAALTKDQAVGALLLPIPIYLFIVPWVQRRASPVRRDMVRAIVVAALAFGVVSGAFVNPSGFRLRVAYNLGPASQPWVEYPRGIAGTLALLRDTARATPLFTSWAVGVAAVAGVLLVVKNHRGLARARALLPLVAAISFTVFFNIGARRTEDRFLLPQSVFFLPYAAIVFDRVWARGPRAWVGALAAVALLPALLGVASMDATLLVDPRYVAERFLDALPAHTRVEVVGSAQFLPRIPAKLDAARPGIEPIADRRRIEGVKEIFDPTMDPRPRGAPFIVLATELSTESAASLDAGPAPQVIMSYRDPISHAFLHGLYDGSLGYARALTATCVLPWPLTCRNVHHSTAGEVWVYARELR